MNTTAWILVTVVAALISWDIYRILDPAFSNRIENPTRSNRAIQRP